VASFLLLPFLTTVVTGLLDVGAVSWSEKIADGKQKIEIFKAILIELILDL
jgi:hypothetical protein